MIEVNAVLQTGGGGYWSDVQKNVTITGIALGYIAEEQDFAELMVYFDTKTWDVSEDGLIYTDRKFEAQLRDMLTLMGLAGDDVDYSEQGMQGRDYVSCDVGEAFLTSYKAKFAEEYAAQYDEYNA